MAEGLQDSGSSPLVTVNQNGVIALNAILTILTTLNTTITNTFPNWVTVPATATSTGVAGQVAYSSSFLYVCTATDTWKRVAISTF